MKNRDFDWSPASFLGLAKQYWLLVIIMVLATWVRVWRLDTHAIFFGDAARDLRVAIQAVDNREIPLLGIPSSVPRFKQGPLSIWFQMAIYTVFGNHLFIFSLFFALINLAALMAIYEFATIHFSQRAGLIAATLYAFSPLTIAQARMPYHTNPIPLALTLYLFALVNLWQGKKWGMLLAVLGWCLVFQFELAVFPLVLLIPYVVWRQQQKVTKGLIIQAGAGFFLGLLPQLLYDITHSFAQLGGFGVWLVYRSLSALLIGGRHGLGPSKLAGALTHFWTYLQRIFSFDQPFVTVAFLIILGLALVFCYQRWRRHHLEPSAEIVAMATGLLTVGYIVHGSPSEAYFPPYFILLPLLISYYLMHFSDKVQRWIILGLGIWAVMNITSLFTHNFFVSTHRAFNYGPGVGEQRAVVEYLTTQETTFYFSTTQDGAQFESYFDNYRYWVSQLRHQEQKNGGSPVYIESKNSQLANYPGIKKIGFRSVDVYQLELP
ncbi:MAG TPA: glycosyltransferase family 39 protein [Vitreimonas sp.]|nr:glycosyltransferase family 39 protein [Vitreimonas sp.]